MGLYDDGFEYPQDEDKSKVTITYNGKSIELEKDVLVALSLNLGTMLGKATVNIIHAYNHVHKVNLEQFKDKVVETKDKIRYLLKE